MKKITLLLTGLFVFALANAQDIKLKGDISAENNQIKNVADPTDAQDATTKSYVDTNVNAFSGSYNDLNNKPITITTDQANAITANNAKISNIQVDWNASKGESAILNKPTVYLKEEVDLLLSQM
jgi:lipopolysaccharide export system protein LptA